MGFFHDSTWQAQQEPQLLLPECEKCKLYRSCQSPFMKVSGHGRKKVLLVAEAPGENEDRKGTQLVGAAGMELVRILRNINVDMRRDCWLTNALICRPTDSGGHNREPLNPEINYCRPNLVKTLKELKPNVVIPLGKVAIKSLIPLAWKVGEVKTMGQWAGWDIPSLRLNTWICPTYHPSYLLRSKSSAVELLMTRQLRNAFTHHNRPWDDGKFDWESRVRVVIDPTDAAKQIESLTARNVPLAFDYETTTLKPDGPNAAILCCSVSDGEVAVAYPWAGAAIKATQALIRSSVPKIAANCPFEERWTWKQFGHGVRNWYWDTVLGARWLNCQYGVCSLKFQAFVLFGVEDYDAKIEPYRKGKGGNGVNRLREVELSALLRYCGSDSLLEVMVAREQWKGVRE